VGERALVRQVRALARQTRREIGEAGLPPDDVQGIADHYGITLRWGRLTDTNPRSWTPIVGRVGDHTSGTRCSRRRAMY
jgi:hypothetical protein